MAKDDYAIIEIIDCVMNGRKLPPHRPIRNGDVEMVQFLQNRAVREVHEWIVNVGRDHQPRIPWPEFSTVDGIQYEREPTHNEIMYALWLIDKELGRSYKKGRDPPRMFQDRLSPYIPNRWE